MIEFKNRLAVQGVSKVGGVLQPLQKVVLQLASGNFQECLQTLENHKEGLDTQLYIAKVQLAMGRLEQAQKTLFELNEKATDNHLKSCIFLENKKLQALKEKKTIYLKDRDLQENFGQGTISKKSKLMFKWYQTPINAEVEIMTKLDNSNKLSCTFQTNNVHIKFPMQHGELFEWKLELANEIIPERSSTKVHLNKIEIIMKKAQEGHSWKTLEIGEDVIEQKVTYPSSTLHKKDWDKLEEEISKDIEKNKQSYGIDPTSDLFKQIFANGNEETRRAMNRSFATSGGTVLSTNWGEVKDKDYEKKDRPQAPSGQQWRKWQK